MAYGGPFIFKFPRKIWDPPKKWGWGVDFMKIRNILYKEFSRNLCRKVTWKKTLEIKTFVKKSQFSKVLRKNVTGNKVLSFKIPETFFPKIMGATNKTTGNKITGIKVLKKIYPKKKKTRKKSLVLVKWVWENFLKNTYLQCICILHI